jgi:signal transduction histidine kinase/CheY-like chemotaxis protein
VTALPSDFDIADSAPADRLSTTQRIESELARRVYRVVALAAPPSLVLYTLLYAWHGNWIIACGAALQLLPLWWAAHVEARRRRFDRALLVIFWPAFVAVSILSIVQGGVLGTASWWLIMPPFALIQVGAMRSGLAMVLITFVELFACHLLHAAGWLPIQAGRPLGGLQIALAVAGSTLGVAGIAWMGVRWRRELLQELDALREHAEEATRVKSRFIANMSHEIRTPLNGIVGAAELLRLSTLDAAQSQAAQIIGHSAQALLAVVNDVLDFSKLEAGRVELERIALDPAALAYDTAETFAGQAHARGVELWAHAAASVPGLIHSDPVRLRQILHNLVSNAMKFTESGEIRIEVDVLPGVAEPHGAPARPAGAQLRFAVRDTGIGLDVRQQARLFQAFTQADVSTTRRFGGTGLGLVICRELATLLGGRLELESAPGVGSTFSLLLPLTPGDFAAATEPTPTVPAHGPGAVVICCASTGLRDDVRDWVERSGHVVAATATGTPEDWLASARGIGADTVVMDDEALRGCGLSRGTWAARLRQAGLNGVLLLGVSVPVVSVPAGLVPLYKPARPQRLDAALREVRRRHATRRDAGSSRAGARSRPGRHAQAPAHRAIVAHADDARRDLPAPEFVDTVPTGGSVPPPAFVDTVPDAGPFRPHAAARGTGIRPGTGTGTGTGTGNGTGTVASAAPAAPGLRPAGATAPAAPTTATPPASASARAAGDDPSLPTTALRGTGELAKAPHTTVLLVEDNAVNQAVARALLAQLRVDSVIAEDGRAALDLLEQGADAFSAVLMDCQMPVLDGFAATRAWRARELALGRARLPVIAMTANSVADAGAACTEAGMDDFVAKPFTLGQLEHVLARWMRGAST